jgi:hypothetical protein
MSAVRDWIVSKLTTLFPNSGTVITSNGQTALFREWTGWDQTSLGEQWASELQYVDSKSNPKAVTTTCNAFLGMVVAKTRIAGGQAQKTFQSFNLPVAGGPAWHWYPDGDLKPKAGDFFQIGTRGGMYKHVGVILSMGDGTWETVEGGQGGPKVGYDMIKRKAGAFPPPSFMGWIDVDEFFKGWGGSGN